MADNPQPSEPSVQRSEPSVVIDLSKGINHDKPAAAVEGGVCARGAGGHAACLGEPVPEHPPVDGRTLVGGASKLTYPVVQQSKTGEADLASHPSSSVWGQWGSTD
ncbi:slit isoform X1 [Chlorella sorokiniana]|jgi:hypothetical protein|uniref:Slit isoform X1 n=1 Tax=Chlorella sorokiniana TaxID=3076 RepID=A0A2P6TXF7_CHLSO|nr:slit isoform X1 [Chlorella sorokiniana]|eukprot:PRW58742.1 slit isoform X1 [Chlorella sorokiniana]